MLLRWSFDDDMPNRVATTPSGSDNLKYHVDAVSENPDCNDPIERLNEWIVNHPRNRPSSETQYLKESDRIVHQ
jgi:hypothetical protein